MVKTVKDKPPQQKDDPIISEADRKRHLEEAASTELMGEKTEGVIGEKYSAEPRADEELGQMGDIGGAVDDRPAAYDETDAKVQFLRQNKEPIQRELAGMPTSYSAGLAGGAIEISGNSGSGVISVRVTGSPKDPQKAEAARLYLQTTLNSSMSFPMIVDSFSNLVDEDVQCYQQSFY